MFIFSCIILKDLAMRLHIAFKKATGFLQVWVMRYAIGFPLYETLPMFRAVKFLVIVHALSSTQHCGKHTQTYNLN